MFDKIRPEISRREEDMTTARPIDIKEIYYLFITHWRWFVVSVFVSVLGVTLWLSQQNKEYSIDTKILMKGDDTNSSSSEKMIMEGLGISSMGKSNIEDEIEIMCSKNVMAQVVMDMQLYVEYREKSGLRKKILYKDTPILLSIDSLLVRHVVPNIVVAARPTVRGYDIKVEYNGEKKEMEFSEDSLHVTIGDISFLLYRNNLVPKRNNMIYIAVNNPRKVVRQLSESVVAVPIAPNSSIVNMSLHMSNVEMAANILTKIVYYYNLLSVNEKNRVAENTERFIDERLRLLTIELGNVERVVEDFMRNNELVDISANVASYLDESNGVEGRLFDVESQINRLNYIDDFISNTQNIYSLIPVIDVENQPFLNIVDAYNKKILEREHLLRSVSESNPVMIAVNQDINILRKGVKDAIISTRNNMSILRTDLLNKKNETQNRIREVPGLQRESAEINRQQAIKDKLYVFLLEKREENSLNKTLAVPMAMIMDVPDTSGRPIAPRPVRAVVAAFLFGIMIPAIYFLFRYYYNDKFRDRFDVERITSLPILGEICVNQDSATHLVSMPYYSSAIAELFRLLRSNLLFITASGEKRIICVTSMISGEGKTFISANLALCMAIMGKRVLMLGLDIRRPQLHHYFDKLDYNKGVTSYLSSMNNNLSSLIQPSGINKNLDILLSGPVPPNPNELLALSRFSEMLQILRKQYEYIIVDTAPVGLVSDTLMVADKADVVLFVVRAQYSSRKTFSLIKSTFSSLPHGTPYLVINGVDINSHTYSYRHYGYDYKKDGTYGYMDKDWQKKL